MKNKKLFYLLRLLAPKELRKFGDFLDSPFFNKNKKVVALWDLLKKHAPSFDAEILGEYSTYETIYTHHPSIEIVFRTTTTLLKEFLTQIRFQNEPLYKLHLLLDELLKKKAHKEFQTIYLLAKEKLQQGVESDLSPYFIQYNYLELQVQTVTKPPQIMEILTDSLDKLDKFYLIQKLMLSVELENLKKTSGLSGEEVAHSELMPTIDKKIEAGWQGGTAAIKALHLAYRLAANGQDADFSALFSLLENKATGLSHRQLNDVCIFAANHCIRRIRKGVDFYPQLFSIYKVSLSNHSVKTDSYFSHDVFKNLVTVGCRLKKYEETRRLIDKHHVLLSPEYQLSTFHFNHGIVDYFEEKYEDAIQRFREAQSDKSIYGVEAQILLIKIYYLTEEVFAFPSLLKALKARVKNAKFLGNQRKVGYKNFCKVIGLLFKLKTEPNYRKDIDSLRKIMAAYPPAGNTVWLNKQLDLLENKRR